MNEFADAPADDPADEPADEVAVSPGGWRVAAAIVLIVGVAGLFSPAFVIGGLLVSPVAVHALVVVVALLFLAARPGRGLGVSTLCLVMVGLHLLWSLDTSHVILEPTGPGGCRVVSAESSFFMSGRGSAGVVGRLGGPVTMVVHYSVDDAATPIRSGDYVLSWSKDGMASLSVPDSYDVREDAPLTCRG